MKAQSVFRPFAQQAHIVKMLVAVLLLLTLACNFPTRTPTPEATQVAEQPTPTSPADAPTATLAATSTPGTSEQPAPTATPTEAPAVEGEGGCTLRAAYVADVTVPDDTEMEKNEDFTKTWRIRNSGTCDWEEGTRLVHVSGERLDAPDAVDVLTTAPDAEVDISVDMTAPDAPGTYRSNWQLEAPDGTRFGGIFYVQIVIPEDITPTPTEEGANAPSEFQGTVAADCARVDFTWVGASGEGSYRIEGPGLNETLPADTEAYTWETPPEGNSVVTLIAIDPNGAEMGRVNTTVNVVCGETQADLAIASVSFDPGTPVAYLPLKVTIRVQNIGDGDSGAFALRWWGGKDFASVSCQWNAGNGVAAGEHKDFVCEDYTYSSPYNNLTARAVVDPDDAVDEKNENNNVLEHTVDVVNPETVYDFVEKAPQAVWKAGDPTVNLTWNGGTGDTEGFARWATGKLETGANAPGKCLETHPRWVDDGWIAGTYTDLYNTGYTIEEGDHFRATVAFRQGAGAGKVTYRVMLRAESSGNTWIAQHTHTYGDGLATINADLSDYAGQRADVILRVDAGDSSEQDWACWVRAVIYRYP
jgi:hypothetical protein